MSLFTIDKICGLAIDSRAEYYEQGEESHVAVRSGKEDYFLQSGGDTSIASFVGNGVWYLGLGQSPLAGDYAALMRGINPRTGESFCTKARKTQLQAEKSVISGFSTSFNVDKSLSLLYAALPNAQQALFDAAMMEATRRTLENLELRGLFAYRAGSEGEHSHPGEVVAATYLHFVNRNLEPHLHVHAEIPNLILGADGLWRTLDARALYGRQVEIAALFDACLATALLRILPEVGTHLEREHERCSLVVAGVDRSMVMQFSSRRREIRHALIEMGADGADAARSVAKRTRRAKKLIDSSILRQRWAESLANLMPSQGNTIAPTRLEVESLLFRNRSVFSSRDLDRVAAQLSILHGGIDAIPIIKSAINQQLGIVKLPSLTDGNVLFTTEEFRQLEVDLLRFARKAQYPLARFALSPEQIDAALAACEQERGFKLRDEQVAAMRHAADGRQLAIIQGAAGTGKSASLAALNWAYSAAGHRVLGLAPSGAAAAELQKSSGVVSRTIHALLIRLENDSPQQRFSLGENDVVVVDEAGMVDTRTLHKLAGYVERAGAKLILVGDSKQLESVGSASTLHMLTQHIGAGRLEQIARQRSSLDCRISQAWFAEEGDPVGLMQERGVFRTVTESTPSAMDQMMADAAASHASGIAWEEILLLADRNAQVRELNDRVRALRVELGELDAGSEELVQVTADQGHARQIRLAVNDRLMLRRNATLSGTPVFNGDRATLTGLERVQVDADANGSPVYDTLLRIKLDRTGEEITWRLSDYDKFDHAYALTVHKSQGLTVEKAFYLVSETTDRRSAYVAFTRSREACPFYLPPEAAAGFAERTAFFRAKVTALDADSDSKARVLNRDISCNDSGIRMVQPSTTVLLEKAGERFVYPGEGQAPPADPPEIIVIDEGQADKWMAQSQGYTVTRLLDLPADTRFRPGKPYGSVHGKNRFALQCDGFLVGTSARLRSVLENFRSPRNLMLSLARCLRKRILDSRESVFVEGKSCSVLGEASVAKRVARDGLDFHQ